MTQPQQNRQTMNKVVVTLNKEYPEVWQKLPAYAHAQDDLIASVVGRDRVLQLQSQITTGVTEDKNANIEVAVASVLAIARNTAAYALKVKNRDLFARLDYGKTYLMGLPNNEQVGALTEMVKQVRDHLEYLGDYNVTKDMCDVAKDKVDMINEKLTSPRDVIVEVAAATKSIGGYEADSREALAIMDRLVHNFQDDYPDFVRKYRQARIIVDAGIRHEQPKKDDDKK